MNWPTVRLDEVAKIDRKGIDPSAIQAGTKYLGLEHIASGGEILDAEKVIGGQLASSKFRFCESHVLYGKLRPYLAKIALPNFCGICSTDILPIRPGPKLDRRYLAYFLRQPQLVEMASARSTGVNLPRLSPKALSEFEIPLPSMSEQERIASILERADGIRQKRTFLLRQVNEFLESAYVHSVGHLNPSHGDWEPYPIETLAVERKGAIRSGPFGSALKHGEFVEDGIAVLGIDNAVKNKFVWAERRFITPSKYQELRRYTVFPGDVIVTIMGTTGRSAVVPDDIPEAITTKHLATITCNKELIHPEVLSFAIHSDPLIIRQIKSFNKGAIMDGLNLGIIRKLEINLPPMEEQLRFVEMLQKARAIEAKSQTPDGSGEDLFQSLSQRAFRGEL